MTFCSRRGRESNDGEGDWSLCTFPTGTVTLVTRRLAAAKRGDVIATAQGLGIPVIDTVDSAFLAHGDPLSLFPFRRPGHYNAAGHRVVAEAVLEALSTITGTSSNRVSVRQRTDSLGASAVRQLVIGLGGRCPGCVRR